MNVHWRHLLLSVDQLTLDWHSILNQHLTDISVDSWSREDWLFQCLSIYIIYELFDTQPTIDWLSIECWLSVDCDVDHEYGSRCLLSLKSRCRLSSDWGLMSISIHTRNQMETLLLENSGMVRPLDIFCNYPLWTEGGMCAITWDVSFTMLNNIIIL